LSVVASVIGLVTLPTAFQMFWGRPKIELTFHETRTDGYALMRCYISNEPINSRVIRKLGVSRTVTNVTADFEIFEWEPIDKWFLSRCLSFTQIKDQEMQ
jgi:hypothetical protein